MLAKSIVQFLAEALLLPIADFKELALESFAPADLILQLPICSG
jgi:hypothetical protein